MKISEKDLRELLIVAMDDRAEWEDQGVSMDMDRYLDSLIADAREKGVINES